MNGVTRLCAARRAELVGRFRVFSFGGFLGIGEKLSFPWIALLQPSWFISIATGSRATKIRPSTRRTKLLDHSRT